MKGGHLQINGQDCAAIAEKYGTPLSVTGGDRVVEHPPWQK
jgi:diaminopimelate decarboxylase